MQLKLAIPQQQNALPPDVDPRPGPTARWINDLPALDPVAALEKIHARLVALNRAMLKPAVRLPVLELIRSRVAAATALTETRAVQAALPMGERQRLAAELAKAVGLELSYGYKAAIVDLSRGGSEHEMAAAIHRAMRCTTQLLIAHYAAYAPEPEGIWRELHQLWGLARTIGVARRAVDDRAAQLRRQSTIQHCYKHALLLGLCKPYQLEARALRRTDIYLERWAGAARIRSVDDASSMHCRFVLCEDCDRPAAPRTRRAASSDASPQRALDTQELVATLNLQLTALRAGIRPELDGLPAEFFDTQSVPLLHHLILNWGVIPSRSFSRAHAALEQRIAVGIEPVAAALRAAANGTTAAAMNANGHCEIVDEGAGGLGLAVTDPGTLSLRVGDVVCVLAPNAAAAPTVGLIRWMKMDAEERIRLGVQKLGPHAAPAVVTAVQTETERSAPSHPVILLPAVEALRQPRALLAARGVYHPQRNLVLESTEGLLMIRAERLVERTACLDWFRYEELEI